MLLRHRSRCSTLYQSLGAPSHFEGSLRRKRRAEAACTERVAAFAAVTVNSAASGVLLALAILVAHRAWVGHRGLVDYMLVAQVG